MLYVHVHVSVSFFLNVCLEQAGAFCDVNCVIQTGLESAINSDIAVVGDVLHHSEMKFMTYPSPVSIKTLPNCQIGASRQLDD